MNLNKTELMKNCQENQIKIGQEIIHYVEDYTYPCLEKEAWKKILDSKFYSTRNIVETQH